MEIISKELMYVNNLFAEAKERGLMFLESEKDEHTNNIIHFKGKKLINFLTNSYLAFENDARVKSAAIQGIEKYGVFSSVSRTYVSFEHFLDLEDKLEQIYGLPSLVVNNVSQGHFAYLPLIVGPNDAVITDQFVHKSVNMAVQYLKGGGIYTEVLRHNQMDDLERRIRVLSESYNKVWYLTDSVFSMHGDVAPFSDLKLLLDSYEKFNLYVDDAHGMSWMGENGKGYALHHIPKHDKLFVICSLNKGYGATNAAMVFPNQEMKDLVHSLGLPIIFSSPTMHAGITAASAIADIHLSVEIYERQAMLNERIKLFKQKAQDLQIPMINPNSHTPIGFIVLGNVEAMAQFGEKMQDRGFVMSIASFPSVPLKHSGFRVTLSLHQSMNDIESLLDNAAEVMFELEKSGVFNRETAFRNIRQNERSRVLV
ncbi:aminotransferase class I and II [Emticicia oligotrophica DSM 17448]|uniref:Aminotransferase class I and II n=1 Tax=Emticicia oligotrophica (strain DSM 17448 / CIP 109782 / MTCC 6937 / GPTSA100-15) TaxID=929562 RepID=A0ABM5N7G1_EMTOG|nr:aminotransferase class I/II-fold pyridoxal phosphate-dependent enzyme [Emticicia oligotrophica]AFK05383.1 aminotransferase class I and II [Emticicia oligotrophica DSM 17448]